MRWIKASERLPEGMSSCFAKITGYREDDERRVIIYSLPTPGWYGAIGAALRIDMQADRIIEWLDEAPDDKDTEIARLKTLIPIARQIGYNEGRLGDNAKPDTDWERFVKENNL